MEFPFSITWYGDLNLTELSLELSNIASIPRITGIPATTVVRIIAKESS